MPRPRYLVGLLAMLAVTGALTGLVAADATAPTLADGADVDAGTVTAGNVATIEVSLPPGTEVHVVLDTADDGSDGDTGWVEASSRTTVAENGTFRATFDLAGFGPNVSFEARLVHEGTVVASAPGHLTACERRCLRTDEVRVLGSVEVDQNRTATVPVTFGRGDRLNVTLTNTTGPTYSLHATVRDTDGDGRATLLFRTAHAGDDEPTLLVREGNETRPAEVVEETALDRTLPAALYRLTARVPGNRNAWDIGTLVVFESSRPPTTTPVPGAGEDTVATEAPETPDPLNVRTDGGNRDIGLLPLGSVGVGGLIAIVGLARLLRR